MKGKKSQAIWWALLGLALLSISVFIFAPLGLVSNYVGNLAPDGEAWIGVFFSLGLSLSIITMSGIAYFKADRRWKIAVIVMAFAEGAISLAVFALKIDTSNITSIGGLLGVVIIQELTIFMCGSAVFVIINQIRNPFASEPNRTNKQPYNEPTTNAQPNESRGAKRTRLESELKANPQISFAELVRVTGYSKSFVSQVRNEWLEKHQLGFKTDK